MILSQKYKECSRPSTRKTKLKEKTEYEKQKCIIYGTGSHDRCNLCGVDNRICTIQLWGGAVRIAEALTILPVFTPAAIPGLFIGCLIGNILGGALLPDIIFGSLATLIGALFTYLLRKRSKFLAPLPPILANIVVVPFVLRYAYGVLLPIPFMMLTVGIGEIISCGVLGMIVYTALHKYQYILFKKQVS